jgi:hypothetical protein
MTRRDQSAGPASSSAPGSSPNPDHGVPASLSPNLSGTAEPTLELRVRVELQRPRQEQDARALAARLKAGKGRAAQGQEAQP